MQDITDHLSDDAEHRRAADALLLRVSRRGGAWLGVMACTALVLAGAETLFPAVLGRAVDAAVGHGASRSWVVWCGVLVALLVVVDLVDDLASGAATARSTAWLRHTLTSHVLRLPLGVGRLAPGDVVSRMIGNTADAGRMGPYVVRVAANAVPALGGTIALGLIDFWLFLTFVVGLPVAFFLVRAFARDASEMTATYLRVQGRIAGRLVDALSGSRTIAASGTQERETARVLAPLPALHRAGMAMWRAQTRILTQDALLVPLLEVAVLSVAGFELARHRITPGAMLAAGQYVVLGATFNTAVGAVMQLAQARASARRTAEILDQPTMSYGAEPLPPGGGRLELRGVTVRREGGLVLDRIDLDISAGALVAVVGRSGSGKSVLAAVVGRLVDPEEGDVLLDGTDLRWLSHDALRTAVSYGFEQPSLLGETIGDVIAFGKASPSAEEVVAGALAARADEFITRMPEGYRTPVSLAPMSGGEAQRVGLARAFAHAGRVIVLDDVAASLDTVTEHHVAEALTGHLAGRTRVVVAHRASTAARADVVVWLEGGRVRAVAPHAELWRHPGYRAQFEPEGADARAVDAAGPVFQVR